MPCVGWQRRLPGRGRLCPPRQCRTGGGDPEGQQAYQSDQRHSSHNWTCHRSPLAWDGCTPKNQTRLSKLHDPLVWKRLQIWIKNFKQCRSKKSFRLRGRFPLGKEKTTPFGTYDLVNLCSELTLNSTQKVKMLFYQQFKSVISWWTELAASRNFGVFL